MIERMVHCTCRKRVIRSARGAVVLGHVPSVHVSSSEDVHLADEDGLSYTPSSEHVVG